MLDVISMVQVLARQYGWRTGCQAGCMNGRLGHLGAKTRVADF